MTDNIPVDTRTGWLSAEDLDEVRDRVPLVYVEAVPVRVDAAGRVEAVGLLLRVRPDGTISRTIVSGRVLHGELVRDALVRHLEKDLGPVALPACRRARRRSPWSSTSPTPRSPATTTLATTP